MFMSVLSGLIVSVDAFFVGLSLGVQKNCRFLYLAIINVFLLGLCVVGFFIAGQIYELIPFDPDLIVGFAFITLGLWIILHYFVSKKVRLKTIVIIGLVMSIEAMIITMGLTFIFLPYSTIAIPITVGLAHFGYSTVSFYLARTRQVRKIPAKLSYVISGCALIAYGMLAFL